MLLTLNADILTNIGHTILWKKFGNKAFKDKCAYDDTGFDKVGQ